MGSSLTFSNDLEFWHHVENLGGGGEGTPMRIGWGCKNLS